MTACRQPRFYASLRLRVKEKPGPPGQERVALHLDDPQQALQSASAGPASLSARSSSVVSRLIRGVQSAVYQPRRS